MSMWYATCGKEGVEGRRMEAGRTEGVRLGSGDEGRAHELGAPTARLSPRDAPGRLTYPTELGEQEPHRVGWAKPGAPRVAGASPGAMDYHPFDSTARRGLATMTPARA
eukprot:scaffold12998_cov113-Isochrysis_galbana.AAC.5